MNKQNRSKTYLRIVTKVLLLTLLVSFSAEILFAGTALATTNTGTFTSQWIDTGQNDASWGTFSWQTTQPSANTSIVFKVHTASNSDKSDATAWSSCTALPTVTSANASSSASISSNNCVIAGGRYIQYQASLSSTDNTVPSVDNIQFSYNSFPTSSPNLTGSQYNTQSSGAILSTFGWTEDPTLSSGSIVTVSIRAASTSGGLTGAWTNFTNASAGCSKNGSTGVVSGCSLSAIASSTNNQYWQYKVTLGSSGFSTPTVSNVSVVYMTIPNQTVSGVHISADNGISSSDFITNTASQTITGTLSGALATGEILYGSVNNGGAWTNITSMVSGTAISWTGATLSGSSNILFKINDSVLGDGATTGSTAYVLETTAPTSTITAVCSSSGNGCITAGASANPQEIYRVQTISGTGADTDGSGVGSVSISIQDTGTNLWYSGTSFTDSSETYLGATGTTTWSYNSSAVPLIIDHTYIVHSKATDVAGNVQTATALSFKFTNSPPTVSNVVVTPETSSGVISVSYDVTDIESSQTTNSLFYKIDATLNGTITSGASSLVVSDGTHLPSAGTIMIDDEMISYSSKSTNTLSGLTRGALSTTAFAHTSGADIFVKATSATGTGIGLSDKGTGKTISWTARTDALGFESASGVIKVVANDGSAGSMIGSLNSSPFVLDAANPAGVTLVLDVNAGTATIAGTDLSTITYLMKNGIDATGGTTAVNGVNSNWSFGSETNKTVSAKLSDPYGNQTSVTSVAPATPINFQMRDLTNSQAQVYGEALSWSKVTDVSGSTATGYEIWRSDNSAAFALLTTVDDLVNSYSDLTVAYNHTYAYKVLTVDADGDKSGFSGDLSNTAGVTSTPPTITLNGANPMTVTKGAVFTDPGAVATDIIDITVQVTVTGTVDANTVNTYTLTYSATNSSNLTSVETRTVNVVLDTTYNITATAGANGTVTPTGITAVASGANQIYTITPDEGYAIATLTVDGTSLAPASTYTFTNVVVAHTIAATFSLNDVVAPVITLNGANPMSVTRGGTYSEPGATAEDAVDGTRTVLVSGTVNTAALGEYIITYTASDLSGNIATSTRTVNVVSATTYDITATSGANGTVTPSGITAVASSENQIYTITPDEGYAVATLTVDGVSLAPVSSYTFTNVVTAHTIAATFSLNDVVAPVITLNGANPMSVTRGGTYSEPGATAEDAVDGTRTVLVSGTVNTAAVGAYTITYTATDLAGNIGTNTRTVNVVYATTYDITATSGANGTVTPSGITAVASEANQMYTMTPDEGYSVATLVIDGVNVAPASTYTFMDVTDSHTISATFTNAPDVTIPVITLVGSNPMDVDLNSTFTDPGATATDDIDGDITSSIVATGTVNAAAIGAYTVTYNVSDAANNKATAVTRTVNVVYADSYDITASATGNGTIDPTGVTSVPSTTSQTYTFTPAENYKISSLAVDGVNLEVATTYTFTNVIATHTISVTFAPLDSLPPVITVTGDNPMNINSGTEYTELGATAVDAVTGDAVEVVTTGTVDATTGGIYTITYTATDTNSNVATATRTVNVADVTPPVITLPATPSVIMPTQAVITWDTNEDATGQVTYGKVSCLANPASCLQSEQIIIPAQWHLIVLSDLDARTPYYYSVTSIDKDNNSATSDEQIFTTIAKSSSTTTLGVAQDVYDALLAQNKVYAAKFGDDTSIPTVSDVKVSDITSFTATISFTTSKDTIAYINYGKDTSYGMLAADDNMTKSHTIKIYGLTLGTEYNFKVKVLDTLNNAGYSENQTFTTKFLMENLADSQKVDNVEQFQKEIESTIESILPSLIPPFIDTPTVTDITENSATIKFRTNVKSYPIVGYVTDANYDATKDDPYDGEVSDVTKKTIDHTIILNNLKSNTKYHVMAKAFSLAQVIGKSADFTFTTSASKIQASVIGVKKDAFTVVWNTDEPTSSIVEYKDLKSGIVNRVVDSTTNSSHSINILGLTPGTSYEVSVSGIDAKGNTIESGTPVSVTTSVDVTSPIISNLKVDSSLIVGLADKVQTIISWQTDEPSTSVVNYAEGPGSVNAPLTNRQERLEYTLNHVVILTSLKAGTVYRFTVESTDGAGNTVKPPVRTIVTPAQTASIMDIIFKNFDDTFKFINNIR